MKNNVWSYYEKLVKKYVIMSIYDADKKVHKQVIYIPNQSLKKYRVNLFKNRKVMEKKLSLNMLEELLSNECKYQMVTINVRKEKKDIYIIISKVSKKKGICSPFIEMEDCILYFPQLRYSDLDLLRYLCEQKKIEGYRLLMVSGC